MEHRLEKPVDTLKGIGEKKARLFEKLGLFTLRDLLENYPRDYEDRTQFFTLAQAPLGELGCFRAVVGSEPHTAKIRQGLTLTKLRVFDDGGSCELTFFNQPFVRDQLILGREYTFYGRMEGTLLKRQMNNPEFELAGSSRLTGKILPVYRKTKGLSGQSIRLATQEAFHQAAQELLETLPAPLLKEHSLCSYEEACRFLHFPQMFSQIDTGRRRVIFEEFFYFTCGLSLMKEQNDRAQGVLLSAFDPEEFYALLPYRPTTAQQRAVKEAFADLCSGQAMHRLVQGDVGSGKTMVAFACLWLAAKNGKQGVLMAPTELLATQHFESAEPLFRKAGFRVALLTGSTPKAARKQLLQELAAGAVDLMIGTHALLEDAVAFSQPALAVTDEQHRFGVRQRKLLTEKTQGLHSLVMSATPIPRTLALMLYGDLSLSVIDELPPGRKQVPTYAVDESYRPRLHAFIEKQVALGGQVYIVCPLIEPTEDAPADERKSAAVYAETLKKALPALKIGLLHGRMKSAEKDRVMAQFSAGEIEVLVSTTVIEVGVNVPRATLMIVEDADRFGLSQLHQLRGRVGRGEKQAYCILVSSLQKESTRQRLAVMTQTNDGFRIAEEDLKLRGPGDFFGDRQHGLPEFKMADLAADTVLLQQARDAASALLAADPQLDAHPQIREKVHQLFERVHVS